MTRPIDRRVADFEGSQYWWVDVSAGMMATKNPLQTSLIMDKSWLYLSLWWEVCGINRDSVVPSFQLVKGVVVEGRVRLATSGIKWYDEIRSQKIPGISGIDTRALTKIIRKHGTMHCNLDSRWGQHGPCDRSAQATVLPTKDNIKQVSTKTSLSSSWVGFERECSRLWSQALNLT